MREIDVNIMHPTDGRVISVTLDETMTATEVIGELVGAEFIPQSDQGYTIAIKGGAMLQNESSLKDNGVRNDTVLRIIPATNAGFLKI